MIFSGWWFGTWLLSHGKNWKISSDHIWLVVWNMAFIFHILGISASQLTKSIIFQRGWYTTSQLWFNTFLKPFVTHIWESSIEYFEYSHGPGPSEKAARGVPDTADELVAVSLQIVSWRDPSEKPSAKHRKSHG